MSTPIYYLLIRKNNEMRVSKHWWVGRHQLFQVRPEIEIYRAYIIWWSFNSSNLKKQPFYITVPEDVIRVINKKTKIKIWNLLLFETSHIQKNLNDTSAM